MSRVAELEARRRGLLLRSAALREELVHHTVEMDHAFHRIDRGIRMARRLSARPMLLAGGAALLFALGPRKMLSWVSRGLLFTSFARRAYALYSATRPAPRREDPHDQLFV